MSKLVCIAGMNKDDEFTLSHGASVIGRAKECPISLFDKKASREHCKITREGNYFAIQDLNSRNGTYVNDKRLEKGQILKIGDRIKVGKTVLLFSDKSAGGVLEHAVADAAADIHEKDFNKAMKNAANVASALHQNHVAKIDHAIRGQRLSERPTLLSRFLRWLRPPN